jgi:uncharacterized protein (DUF849 family)
LLQAALNGEHEHPAAPRTPEELAAQASEAVEAGAQSLHLHPYNDHGREPLGAEPCAAALRTVRAACPGVPVYLSTSAANEPLWHRPPQQDAASSSVAGSQAKT